MPAPDPELEQLIRLIGTCLGSIDEHANRIVDEDGEPGDYRLPERIDDEMAMLQELVESLLVVDLDHDATADVNSLVRQVMTNCLDELQVPIVIRQALAVGDTTVPAPRALVTGSLQRAMLLAIEPLGPGDELRVTTRIEADDVLVEIESMGGEPNRNLLDRSETLRDFVEEFGGRCQVRAEQRDLLIAIELPRARVPERSDSHGFA